MKVITKKFNRLPVPINHAYLARRGGGRFLSLEAKQWKEEIGWAFKKCQPSDSEFGIDIIIHQADKRKRDIDGGIKFILDSLNGVVWIDDSQVSEVHIFKFLSNKNLTEISVWRIN